jgi:CTP:molybdopterin cytidylyltransferase MocA
MGIGAVIVAAGMSSRMGDFKPMLKVGTTSMLQHICANLQQAGIFPIVLVTGFRGDELEQLVARSGVICVRNANYATTQMFDSAKIGFEYIADKCDRVFFTPADIPLFTADTLKKLSACAGKVIKPIHNGKTGHPILLAHETMVKLLSLDNTDGLRGALSVCCDKITTVEVDDEGVLYDADTPEDYSRLLDRRSRRLLR